MNILRQSAIRAAVPWQKMHQHLHNYSITMGFSEYFREKDKMDVWQYEQKKIRNKKYRALLDLWQKPLQKKRLRQARIKQIKENLQEKQPQLEKFIVHNPALGIKSPPQPDNIFAVIKVDDRQYKVTNDCILVLDTKQTHEINQNITFKEVLLVGTDTYTLLGRPLVTYCQSISRSQKVIVFKKKRRKQYKKSFGHRSSLTTVRINNIVHTLCAQVLEKAVPL